MRRVTLLSIVAAFALPPSAHAADYIALTVSPTQVAPGWSLETSSGACRTTTTSGAATGSFSASFVGWGTRTLRLGPGIAATFNETR